MNQGDLHIDVSRFETDEDLIEIRMQNEEVIQVSFSKLVKQSKYIRDKYKYSEAVFSIQFEIEKAQKEFDINTETIKSFIKLVDTGILDFPVEDYKHIYALSKHFNIDKITKELDKLLEKELSQNLNFALQQLIEREGKKNEKEKENEMNIKLENFLKSKINECLQNSKFKKLSNSTISRILSKSQTEVNQDELFEFILESASTRFILIKFVELDKMSDDKIEELIFFIEKQEENQRKIYLDYIPFNLSFIKLLKNKSKQFFDEMNETKEELNKEKIKHEETKEELNKEKTKHEETKEELNKEKIEHEELNKEIERYKNTSDKQNQEIEELKELNEKLKLQLKEYEEEKKKKERLIQQQHKYDILVAGYDPYYGLGEKPNNKSKCGRGIISPFVKLSFDPSSLLSYSIYYRSTVLVTSESSLKGIGYNEYGQITSSLPKRVIDHFTDFSINDDEGRHLDPVSAVCCESGVLYMFSKNGSGRERQLVLCDCHINWGTPVFLDIGNHQPVSLFGGRSHSACICSEGEVIFINRNSVQKSPQTRISSVSLPSGLKASSVACCNNSVFVLSSTGRVFTSEVNEGSSLSFSEVLELKEEEIVCVSGTYGHCLAVSKEGHVFVRGSNSYGQLGLGKGKEASSFTKISSLEGYEIISASAGGYHSLFLTRGGKILSCGSNDYGELLLKSGPSEEVYLPTETTITGGATFCIAGYEVSSVFIDRSPPSNTPNRRIQQK